MNIYALCISSRGCIRFKDFFLIGCFAKYPSLLIQYILSIQSRRNMLAVLYLVMLNGKINTRFKRLMTWFLNYKHSFFSSKDGHSWSIISTGIENGDLIWSFHISSSTRNVWLLWKQVKQKNHCKYLSNCCFLSEGFSDQTIYI